MKKYLLSILIPVFSISSFSQEGYTPAMENLENREWFQDAKFGLFVHWGVYSTLANGEWVMHNTQIPIVQYEKLPGFFNPISFDPYAWIAMVKKAGMKYIVITSKHHDGFAMYDSKVSDYDIVDRTPYKKDVLKMLADACDKEGIKLYFYYSHLDWHHPDFYQGGATGQYSGREKGGDFQNYLDYMNEQIRELLTDYGEIGGIWFDGVWDNREIDWQLEKTYSLIHDLQPACMIGNNHHVATVPGEDFQMFEKDLPGHNTTGWADDQSVSRLPLETCETISGNGSWGFSIYDKQTKSPDFLIKYLVKAAGYNSNFLLNVGPMPDGRIRPEHIRVLEKMGEWMDKYGETIYGTRGGPFEPQEGFVSTQKGNKIFIHIFERQGSNIELPSISGKIKSARIINTGDITDFIQNKNNIIIEIPDLKIAEPDLIVELVLK